MPEAYTEAHKEDTGVLPTAAGGPEVSSSVQEIISGRPGYFVRKGTTIIFLMLCLIIAGMWFIHYPDTLEGPMVLTTDPLPIKLKYSGGGRLIHLFAQEGAMVGQGQAIAELENNTGYDNIRQLSIVADTTLAGLQRNDITVMGLAEQNSLQSLGDGQSIYNSLLDAVNVYILQHNQRIYSKRASGLQSRIASYQSLSVISRKEQALIDEELKQADERFKANEQLYGSKVISRQEYYDEAARMRQKKLALEQQKRAGLQNSIFIADNDKQMLEVRYEQEEKESTQSAGIREQVRNLQNFVQSWKLKYLLYAPYDGKVHFLRPLQVNETIASGEEVCAIVPARYNYIAIVNMPAQGSGKLQTGQDAHLLPDQFPYNEYGYIKGIVSNIAALPQDNKAGISYRISVTLPDALVTSYHRRLPFTAEMNGTARIITKDRNLLERLLSGFAKLDK